MQTKPLPTPDATPPLPSQHVNARLGSLLGRVYRQWRRQIDLSFKPLGLSDATRMPLLELYARGEPLRQKDLADALFLDTSSLVRVLAFLREAGFIDWTTDPSDRRSKRIALTPHGVDIASQILARSLEIEQTILADLSDEQLSVTRGSLHSISRRFDSLGD